MSGMLTNVSSLTAQHALSRNILGLNRTLERLATGLKINRGSDDPAGLVSLEQLRAEMQAIDAAMANAERADHVLNVAEAGLSGIGDMLADLQGLAVQAADSFLSEDARAAIQLEADSILSSIDRVVGSTSFAGRNLLDGSYGGSGGAQFAISPSLGSGGTLSVSIPSVSTDNLGQSGGYSLADLASGGSLNFTTGDVGVAQTVIDAAVNDVATLRGRLGAVQRDVLQPAIRSLGITAENVAAAASAIGDTDYAEEAARLTRDQLLTEATVGVLKLANARPSLAWSLLG